MITSAVASDQRSPGPAPETDSHTLAGEHALLLRDVRRRATPVLAVAAARSWPADALRTLIEFLQHVVLRQVSDEERLLYPGDYTAVPFAELSAGHLRLHALTQQLIQASTEEGSLLALASRVEELLHVLQQHLIQEQAVLAALPDAPEPMPATTELTAGTLSWAPAAGHSLILLDTLPEELAVTLSVERLLRMRPGETADVRSSDDPLLRQVWDWMRCYDTSGYGYSYSAFDPQQWQLQVIRRPGT